MRKPALGQRLAAAWLRRLVSVRVIPDQPDLLALPEGAMVCYVLERDGVSMRYILEQACTRLSLPGPFAPWPVDGTALPDKRFFALRQSVGWMVRRPGLHALSRTLEVLDRHVAGGGQDVWLVPVSILVGRAPERDWKWWQLLFSEDWAIGGPIRRLITLLIHGRHTQAQFGKPVSLKRVQQEVGLQRSRRKATVLLRQRLRNMREAAIGPDLSHRRTMINTLLDSPMVRAAIRARAEKRKISVEQARREARDYALEIAADYSYTVVRLGEKLLTWFWNRVYDGIDVHRAERLHQLAQDHNLVYVPCHRSHFDYLLMSYILYQQGLVPPHIAAGVNLNLPLVGALLRRGGAFYIRRSFRNNRLYSAVFHQYVAEILRRGVAMEYFIEGTRSRTGKLLQPKAGMLSMTVRSHIRQPGKPLLFMPVYIGYEKLAEGSSYIRELSGAAKTRESLLSLLKTWRVVRDYFGQVHVSFGDPIVLDQLLDRQRPDWRDQGLQEDERPEWVVAAVNDLSRRIMQHINATAHVNAVNLVAQTLLSTPKQTMDRAELLDSLELSRQLLQALPGQEEVLCTGLSAEAMVARCERLGFIHRQPHPLGDLICSPPDQALLLSYFSNNTLHAFVLPAWVAAFFVHNRRFDREDIVQLGRQVYPYLAEEYFLPWSADAFMDLLQSTIDLFLHSGLLHTVDGGLLQRAEAGQFQAVFMTTLSQNLVRTLERYFLVISVLVRHGSGRISTSELERISQDTARKIAMVQEFSAPEYFERSLFRTFIATLRREGVVWPNDDNALEFDQRLTGVLEQSKLALSQSLRHGILRCIPEPGRSAAVPEA